MLESISDSQLLQSKMVIKESKIIDEEEKKSDNNSQAKLTDSKPEISWRKLL